MVKDANIYITAILPAHNEGDGIANSISSIRDYVDKIIVACDHCTDDTSQQARIAGADIIFNTVNNNKRKAGALNQALRSYVDWSIANQYCLIMDADTVVIDPKRWFGKATQLLYPNRPKMDPEVKNMSYLERLYLRTFQFKKYNELFEGKAYDCIGSIFQAPKTLKDNNNLEQGQRLEWEGYASKIERAQKVFVLTGTCSLISCDILLKVYILNLQKYFYDEESITEDFAMTISVKEVGARLISPTDCLCHTETKDNVKDLLNQRRRWYLGAIELVSEHKVNKVMLPYIFQQIMLFISVIAFLLFLIVSIYIYATGNATFTWFWFAVFIGFDLNQVGRIWKYGNTFDRLYAFTMIGCLYYSLILQIAYLWALESYLDRRSVYWNEASQEKRDDD